jgi:hypothetical protein
LRFKWDRAWSGIEEGGSSSEEGAIGAGDSGKWKGGSAKEDRVEAGLSDTVGLAFSETSALALSSCCKGPTICHPRYKEKVMYCVCNDVITAT